MYRASYQVERNRNRSLILACLMLFGALSAGIPNAAALTGNESISGSSLTNSSATLSLGNLDTNDTYYWWVWVSDSGGNLTAFDYDYIYPNSSSMTVLAGWATPTTTGNYTVDAEITDSSLNILANSSVGTFFVGGGGGGTIGNGSQNDAGSGGDAGDNATAAYNLSVTSGSTYAGYVDQTDVNDWYRIFVPTGKGITASMSFNGVTNGTNDLDLYLVDSNVTTYIDTSYYSNPEVVNSSGTNVSGQYVYLVVDAYTGFSYYNFTVSFFNIGGGGTGSGGQNDAGSGGDAGDNATAAYNLSVTAGSTYAGYADQNDTQDWYLIFVPTGKGITASMSFNGVTNGTNDLDLVLIDSTVSFYIDTSYYSNPEVVNSSGTNVSGQYVYLVVNAFSGFSYYNFTVTFYNVGGSSGGITADQYEINNDVGNATAITLPFSPNSLTIHNSTDWDVFAISMTSGMTYWMNATFTHSAGDLDIYITDSSLNLMSYSESMTDDEATSWTANATGTFYAIVLGYQGATNTYDLSLEGGASNVTGDVSVIFYNRTYGELTSFNLTSASSYDLDVHLLVPNGTNFTSVASYTDSWTSNGSNNTSPAYITLVEEGWFCLYGELYDTTHSALGVYVADDMDCLYHEMMEASITSDTSANMNAQNITSGLNYTYQWGLYIAGASNYSQTGNGSFTATGSSWSSTATWNQPNSGLQHCFYVELSYNGSVIGEHEDCFYPTWPSLDITGYVANSNATTNPIYFNTSNLTVGNFYYVQVGIVQQSTNNTTSISAVTNFTASSSTESWYWNYTTPTVSGNYCVIGGLWDSNGVLLDTMLLNTSSTCFLIIHDDDNDGVWNVNDLCPNTPANAPVDLNGCAASQRDTDGDGVNDSLDPFPFDGTQWQDSDGDGYGDNASGNNPDAFPNDATQHSDGDGDGYGDNASGNNPDAFPTDSTQWSDSDGDGYGDNSNVTGGDLWPNDSTQWWDSDGDGYGDNSNGTNGDAFPSDPTQWADSDGDGYGDNSNVTGGDLWPNDPSQWWDSDGDGYGDNSSGTNGDAFPTDPTQWSDGDGDGWGDNPNGTNPDAFPQDATQWSDGDGDGYGDNPNGNNADAFPTDSTQWADADGDGYGDNPNGNNPDAFPSDATQHSDGDGDGYGDNPQGNNPDAFPTDATQWADRDGDGYGDNPLGTNPDQCPDTPAGETVDSTGCSATERDSDGDGVMDAVDDCLHINASGWDNDGDGCIDDTDGDGYPDPDDGCVNEDSTGHDADQDGCIDDSDGDLVKDNVDQCPTTNASGFDSDLDGCIDDSDGDLVPDDVDDCRYVNATGYDNDGDGCIDDTDGDNIKDNLDSCPYENATGFDDNQDGCLDDSDSDGVKDNTDLCPNTVDYLTIDNSGCSDHQRDSDSDTVKDFYDICPNTLPGQQVNTDGCSASQRDTDGDTVSDADDACPDTDSGASVDLDGCADTQLDSDNDGVNDSLDQCTSTPTNETANNMGCSDSEWDSDGDGFMDSDDDCPNEDGSSTTDRTGCIDSDQDGVSDLNDAFPQDATKQTASDSTEEGGFSPMVVALVGMFVLFSIVAGALIVLRMRRGGDVEEQFSGGLTMQPAVSLTEMAMPAQAATELGLQTATESLVAADPVATPDAEPEQWVDENGVTWHRQPDGVLLRWNGEAWEPAS
ncbi:MAG: hypothetical protein QF807_06000 [Candidatus Thalassarchaeaceae archaeon]|nr:hypothetical protein [Candidatus Thalassarchaeaceae archaeon]